MDLLLEMVQAFLGIVYRMAPWMLLGFMFAGLFALFFTPEMVQRHLGGRGFAPVLKSVLLGVPLPLCSCGVVPVAAALRSSGASRGSTAAFFISTPQTGVDSMIVTFSLLGWVIGIIRPLLAMLTGLVGGVLIGKWVKEDDEPSQEALDSCSTGSCCCGGHHARPHGFVESVRYVLWYSLIKTPKTVSTSLLLGMVIAALIEMFVPEDFGASYLRGNVVLEFVAMIVVALPLYVCSTGAIPIAASLMMKGISPGAALVFMIAGPATNSAMMASMVKLLGGRATAIYLIVLTIFAVTTGILINLSGYTYGGYGENQIMQDCCISVTQRICGVALLLLLGWGMFGKLSAKK